MNITAAAAGKTLGKEDFLRLFTNQLKFQDPLNPMDSTEFTAQMAQFSSLEQLININSGLEQMLTSQSAMNNGMAAGFIGKTVVTQDGTAGRVFGVEFSNNTAEVVLESGKKYPVSQIGQIYETKI